MIFEEHFGLRHRDAALRGADASAPRGENPKIESGDTSPQSKTGSFGMRSHETALRGADASAPHSENPKIENGDTSPQSKWKPYPKYRDSGVEWLGPVPEGWEVIRLKNMTKINPEILYEDTDPEMNLIYIDIGGVDSNGRILEKLEYPFAMAPSRARRIVKNGDIIVSTVRTYLRAIAKMQDPDPNTIVSTGFAVIRCENPLLSEYAFYSLRAPYFVDWIVANSKGVSFPAISETDVASFFVIVPSNNEQSAISTFLDRETSKIDSLIAKKERLIELLQEKRTALITRAVTKGLFGMRHRDAALDGADASAPGSGSPQTESGDTSPQSKAGYSGTPPHVNPIPGSQGPQGRTTPKFKDSGVEWLGEVPAHWQIKRLKYLLKSQKAAIKTGPFGSQLQSSEMMAGEIKVYNQRNVIDGDFIGGENYISEDKFDELKAFQVFSGDLLVTTRGSIGRCAELPENAEKGILHPCLMRLQVNRKLIDNNFLELLIEQSGLILEQLHFMSNATTIDVIYSESMKEVWNAIPPFSEQLEILNYLKKEMDEIDTLISRIQSAISLLKEYRTALISAAVTGKIDVRGEFA